jgi:periplasmic protein CpxP/Spy
MRKLALSLLLLIGVSTFAQQGKNDKPDFTPEQEAQLRTKELGLQLDLNDRQMIEVEALELKLAQERASMKEERKDMKTDGLDKPTDDELFEMKNERLDKALQHQEEMKKILTPEQYEKWKALREEHLEKERAALKEKRQGKMENSK